MAMCDAHYRFTAIDVGALGREGDRGIFATSILAELLENNDLNLPGPEEMPFSKKVLPYVIVGDEGFPLKTFLIRPYPGRAQGTLDLRKKI